MIDDGDLPDSPALRDGAPQKPATIYDVARLAGVSHQTVSRHFRGYEGIRPETRERVTHALENLDYRPNMTARSWPPADRTASGPQPGDRTGGTEQDRRGRERRCPRGGLSARHRLARRREPRSGAGGARPDHPAGHRGHPGLHLDGRDDPRVRNASIRVPTLIEVEDDDAIGRSPGATRNFVGLRLIVDHLVSLGHRRFFHIAGPLGWVSARNRELSYERACAARPHIARNRARRLVRPVGLPRGRGDPRRSRRTALVVANDQMALGAMLALERRGWHVPADISVTGFDDIPEAAYYRPPLTLCAWTSTCRGGRRSGGCCA